MERKRSSPKISNTTMLSLWTVLCRYEALHPHLANSHAVHMPRAVMDGYEATEKMRAAGYCKPIAVAATTFAEDRINVV
jgi:hypothetical protein